MQLCRSFPADAFENLADLRMLFGADHRCLGADHGPLLLADRRQGAAKVFAVVQADRRHGDHRPMRVGGGGIEPSAQPNLQHHQVHCIGLKVVECHGQELFKRGQPVLLADPLQFDQPLAEGSLGNLIAINADAFAPAHQVGRGG